MKHTIQSVTFVSLLLFGACTPSGQQDSNANNASMKVPEASTFVSSPLRNRVKFELNASQKDAWDLIGDPAKMPLYSKGLVAVDTKHDANGNCTEYLCHFKPFAPGEDGVDHRAFMKWYEPLAGWASVDEEPNLFGLSESLTLITFHQAGAKTIVQWDMHFNAEDVTINRDALEVALNDIANNLIGRFGGRLIENFAEGKTPQDSVTVH